MIALLVKSTVAILGALLLVTLARRSRASLRHLILSALFAFLLLLPAIQSIAPALKIPVPATVTGATGSQPVEVLAMTETRGLRARGSRLQIDWLAIGIGSYLAVAALLLSWLAIGVMRLRSMAARADVWLDGTTRMNEIALEANIRRSALVVLSRDTLVPLTFGFRRSTIVMPEAASTWDADELTRALRHELEHVRREDWLLQLVARVACALYWPHPLVWSAWRRFCLEAERACDDAVIRFSEPAAYAGQLVSLARNVRFTTVPALGMASRSKLAQRVDAILDPKQRRGPHGDLAAAAVFALLLALLVGVAPARLIAAAAEVAFDPNPDVDFDFDIDRAASRSVGERLVRLAESGNIEELQRLFDKGVDINMVMPGDGTALIGAARAGEIETVDFLLDNNADPNLASRGDGNPLIAAAAGGYGEVVARLLDAGADRDAIVPGDENPLMQAARYGHDGVVHLLLERGADANAQAYEDGVLRTPLRLARNAGHVEIVRMLIAAGAKE
ncbi:MAG TPA: ankyrin repeat domain-containing protein [Thermoanaerobaculia bacterium]|nr:ankyrin repeat domain-containing protein [Thermoanaerobaculia bacterium]